MADSIKQLEELVSHGRYLEARELGIQLKKAPDANVLRINQLLALSLSKSGAPQAALEELGPIYQQNPNDPETAGIMGGIYKELFKKHRDSKYAILSRDTYLKNFNATKSYYTGINSATMSAIAGRARQGRELAGEVISIIGKETSDYWAIATLGEAYLLTKDRTQAIEHYIKARQMAGNDWGKVISVYNQLWLLNHYISVPKEIIRVFSPPTVVASIGHMIDHPNRKSPRFPADIEEPVRNALEGSVRAMNAGIAYCSVACGSDILFAEAVEKLGGELNLFIPFKKEDFKEISVSFAGDDWVKRFERLVNTYPVTYLSHDPYEGNDDIFAFQCKVIFGSAMLRSKVYDQQPMLLSVQSEIDLKRKKGGTRDTIWFWPLPERHTTINPDQFLTIRPEEPTATPPESQSSLPKTSRPVLYLVMIDLSEAPVMESERIYKLVNAKMDDQLIPFKAFDISGNIILIAFETETGAIDFTQLILDAKHTIKEVRHYKIGLHAGPVLLENQENEMSNMLPCEALEVVRRISKLTPMGSVCASDQFASLLALNTKKFELDYAGLVPAGKEGTAHGIYSVLIK